MLRREGVSAVIFDLDGVLFDTRRMREERAVRIAELMNVHPTTFDFGGRHYKEVLRKRGFSWWQVRKFKWLHDKMRREEEEHRGIVFGKAEAVLRSLKNYGKTVGILTNREMHPLTIKKIFDEIQPNRIDFLVFHCPWWRIWWEKLRFRFRKHEIPHCYILSPYAKPDARMSEDAKKMLQDLPGYPSSIYYVGDNVNDLRFAEACGFGFVGVLSGRISDANAWRAHDIDVVMKDIGEFLQYFPDFKRQIHSQ